MKSFAIFLPGQAGDILEASCVLHYRKELFGDCKIVWFLEERNFDLLKYQDIELRTFPRGFGYPEMVAEENKKLIEQGKEPIWEDWQPLVDENNHLNIELANRFPSLKGISQGYFPAPHQMSVEKRDGIEYANVSKKVFGIPDDWEWHPVLNFSDEEREMVTSFMLSLPNRKNFLIETFCGSGQTSLNEGMIKKTIEICNKKFVECNFIFASHKFLRGDEVFPEWLLNLDGFVNIKHLTVRQTGLVIDFCDLMICVSSGISVATSCCGAKQVTKLQYCGSSVCSTVAISNGKIETVYCDDRILNECEFEFYEKLKILIEEI